MHRGSIDRNKLCGNQQAHIWFLLTGWLLTSAVAVVLYWVGERPDLRYWEGMETHAATNRHAIALTFDDGPHPLWSPLLADTLEQHSARGTFFLVGIEAQRYPEITARLVRAGHQVASHSLTHPYPNLTVLPKQQIAQEIQSSVRVLSTLTGKPIRDFRAPGGGVNDAMIEVLKANHLRMAWWSTNIGDWNSPTPEVIATRLHRSLRPGLVVLMHQRENSVSALDCFLADGQQGGYTYTTFSSLMRQ